MDELSARTGIRKDKVAKLLWHLEALGWVAAGEETRLLRVYRRLRDVPAARRFKDTGKKPAAHIAALNAAFGIGRPVKRARARTIRRGE